MHRKLATGGTNLDLLAGGKLWIGIGSDCTFDDEFTTAASNNPHPETNLNCKYLPFTGSLGVNGSYRHLTQQNNIEELQINGRGLSPHLIHIHVNHFQVYSANNSAYTKFWGQIGDWRDTTPALDGSMKVRYSVQNFSGEIVLHCHFLYHEDAGMMATYYALPSNSLSANANPYVCNWPNGTSGGYCMVPITATGLATWIIVVIGIACGIAFVLIGLIAWCCCCRVARKVVKVAASPLKILPH